VSTSIEPEGLPCVSGGCGSLAARRFPLAVAATALVVAAAAGQQAAGQPTATGLVEAPLIPRGTQHIHNGPLLKTRFKQGVPYAIVISRSVDISPSASRKIDAVYCFESAVGTPCTPPYVVGGVQLTWYRGFTGSLDLYPRALFLGGKKVHYARSHVYKGDDRAAVRRPDPRRRQRLWHRAQGQQGLLPREGLRPGVDPPRGGTPPRLHTMLETSPFRGKLRLTTKYAERGSR
jgi:hypothetical protein